MTHRRKRTELLRIGEVALLAGVSAQTVRNWEAAGLLKVRRNQAKYRLYTRETVNQLKEILYLKQVKGLNTASLLQVWRNRQTHSASKEPPRHSLDLAVRLAQLRSSNCLTLNQVAQSTRLPARYLSAIEKGQIDPSIAALQKLAETYRTNIVSFFDVDGEQRKLVRLKDRRYLTSGPGVEMQLLAFGSTQMEVMLFRIAPRTSSGGAYHHQGEEFLYLLEGKLEMWLDEIERYVLESGDSLYFKSTQSHRWRSLTDRECVLLWVNTPPTF